MTLAQLRLQSAHFNNLPRTLSECLDLIKENKVDFNIVWEGNNTYEQLPGTVISEPKISKKDTSIEITLNILGGNKFCAEPNIEVKINLYLLDCIAIINGHFFFFEKKGKDGSLNITLKQI